MLSYPQKPVSTHLDQPWPPTNSTNPSLHRLRQISTMKVLVKMLPNDGPPRPKPKGGNCRMRSPKNNWVDDISWGSLDVKEYIVTTVIVIHTHIYIHRLHKVYIFSLYCIILNESTARRQHLLSWVYLRLVGVRSANWLWIPVAVWFVFILMQSHTKVM